MKNWLTILVIASLPLLVISCAKDSEFKVGGEGAPVSSSRTVRLASPLSDLRTAQSDAQMTLNEELAVKVFIPGKQKHFWERHVKPSRDVGDATVDLKDFRRTIEDTDFQVQVELAPARAGTGTVTLQLYGNGKKLDEAVLKPGVPMKATLKGHTPKISKKERPYGVALAGFDIFVTEDGKRSHRPFTVAAYDEDQATMLQSRDVDCEIFHEPDKVWGPMSNWRRTPDSFTTLDQNTEFSPTYNNTGGVSITPGLLSMLGLQFSVGTQVTKPSTQVSKGLNWGTTNCIECVSVIWRQKAETIRPVDVYTVRADGSVEHRGSVLMHQPRFSYAVRETDPESGDYDYNSPKLVFNGPVGVTEGCRELGAEFANLQ